MPLAENLLSQNRPSYTIEEICLDAMTEDLKPSRFLYIRSVIEEEFNMTMSGGEKVVY